MPEPTRPASPLPAHSCPVCGQPNACAAAASESFDTPCWCRVVSIAPAALARVPAALVGRACLCARCASVSAE